MRTLQEVALILKTMYHHTITDSKSEQDSTPFLITLQQLRLLFQTDDTDHLPTVNQLRLACDQHNLIFAELHYDLFLLISVESLILLRQPTDEWITSLSQTLERKGR